MCSLPVETAWQLSASDAANGPIVAPTDQPCSWPRIANLPEWRAHLLTRRHRQAAAAGDARLAALHEEVRGYPGGEGEPSRVTDVAVPLRYRYAGRELSFFSMTAVVGAPMHITVGELALESFYPADDDTAAALRELAGR